MAAARRARAGRKDILLLVTSIDGRYIPLPLILVGFDGCDCYCIGYETHAWSISSAPLSADPTPLPLIPSSLSISPCLIRPVRLAQPTQSAQCALIALIALLSPLLRLPALLAPLPIHFVRRLPAWPLQHRLVLPRDDHLASSCRIHGASRSGCGLTRPQRAP